MSNQAWYKKKRNNERWWTSISRSIDRYSVTQVGAPESPNKTQKKSWADGWQQGQLFKLPLVPCTKQPCCAIVDRWCIIISVRRRMVWGYVRTSGELCLILFRSQLCWNCLFSGSLGFYLHLFQMASVREFLESLNKPVEELPDVENIDYAGGCH